MTRVIVYSREGCHLCEDLLEHMARLAATHAFEYQVRDIDREPALRERYHARVPVVACDGEEVCEFFLDQAGLLARLGEEI